jgi:hypothetical protein
VSSVSNGLYFLTLLLVSVMRVIYTSKGMLKKSGVRVIYRKIRYLKFSLYLIENLNAITNISQFMMFREMSAFHSKNGN